MKYEPMLARASTHQSGRRPVLLEDLTRQPGWFAQEKLDGIRAMIESDGSSTRVFTRTGREITEKFPEVARLRLEQCVIDAELVARDGTFQTVATREKQTTDFARHERENPCLAVAFDLLEVEGENVARTPAIGRVDRLRRVVRRRRNLRVVRTSTNARALYDEMLAKDREGIIAKRARSIYLPGQRSDDWVKFKTVRRITAIATGYERGPSLAFGAMKLGLVDGKKIVHIGKVGTGWTIPQMNDYKARLDDGSAFLVEIEALGRTPDGLRFPVLVGERADLSLADANVGQLETLPLM